MRASPRRNGGDGRFTAGFVTAVLLLGGSVAAIRLGRWLSTTDLAAWATAPRTATYTYLDVALQLLGVVMVALILCIVIIAPQIMRGGFSSG